MPFTCAALSYFPLPFFPPLCALTCEVPKRFEGPRKLIHLQTSQLVRKVYCAHGARIDKCCTRLKKVSGEGD